MRLPEITGCVRRFPSSRLPSLLQFCGDVFLRGARASGRYHGRKARSASSAVGPRFAVGRAFLEAIARLSISAEFFQFAFRWPWLNALKPLNIAPP